MNRWICRDLYNWRMMEDFWKWRENQVKVKKDLGKFRITYFESIDKWYFIPLNGKDQEYLPYASRNPENIHHGSFVDCLILTLLNDTLNPGCNLPERYYFSNGSLLRLDGTYGWSGFGHL